MACRPDSYQELVVRCCGSCYHMMPEEGGGQTCNKGIPWGATIGRPARWGPLVSFLGLCDGYLNDRQP